MNCHFGGVKCANGHFERCANWRARLRCRITSVEKRVPMTNLPKYPKGPTSIRAHVLAVLLSSEDMTGFESIFAYRKASLTTVIRALIRKYHWPILREDFPTNTADGRAAWATVYSIPQVEIDAAFRRGAQDWLDGVKAARNVRQ
jgi:hypothetical protein